MKRNESQYLFSVQRSDMAANNKYNHRYNNALFTAAISGKSNKYANGLINEALAICGSPFYKISNRKWSDKAMDFLKVFDKQ